jgi:hypothetical protein
MIDLDRLWESVSDLKFLNDNYPIVRSEIKLLLLEVMLLREVEKAARDLVVKANFEYSETELLSSAQDVEDLLTELDEARKLVKPQSRLVSVVQVYEGLTDANTLEPIVNRHV